MSCCVDLLALQGAVVLRVVPNFSPPQESQGKWFWHWNALSTVTRWVYRLRGFRGTPTIPGI
eukprot:1371053-Amphidinium_carterae.1